MNILKEKITSSHQTFLFIINVVGNIIIIQNSVFTPLKITFLKKCFTMTKLFRCYVGG